LKTQKKIPASWQYCNIK